MALAAALTSAFVLAPPLLAARPGAAYADERELTAALDQAFTEYWHTGTAAFTPGLSDVVGYWLRYHVVKAVAAAALLVVLVALGVLLWRAHLRAGGTRRRVLIASGGVVLSASALSAVVVVMANIQGAAAPYASLLPMLVPAGTLEPARRSLEANGGAAPAVQVMVEDFTRYHLVLAVLAAAGAVAVLAASVAFWRRSRGAGGRARWSLGSFGVATALLMVVVAVANATTATDPAPALLAFLNGGW